jgi:DNA polymerase bacteriophage-type
MPKITFDVLHLDYETFSEVNLLKTGTHPYAMHKSTDVNCLGWAFNKEEPTLWIPGMPIPKSVRRHIESDGAIFAWNAMFERLITKYVMVKKYGWPEPAIEQYYCVMVMAMAMGLPGKLDKAAPAVGIDLRKDPVGHRAMMRLCKPRKPTKSDPSLRFTRDKYKAMFEAQDAYCLQDVRVEQGILDRVVLLKKSEQAFWWRDQHIQDRGCRVDVALVGKSYALIEKELKNLNARMRRVTGEMVSTVNATKQLVDWLKAGGVAWPENTNPSVDKDNVERLLMRDDLSDEQREAIEIRKEAAKTSTAKLERALSQLCRDGTVKGQLQFHGAGTGRDGARGLQLQNLPRPSKNTVVKEAIADILNDYDLDLIRTFHGNPMQVIADILRGIIIAKKGKKLWTRDLSQIEARMTFYLAGQHDKVQAFRDYDAKIGPDIYIIAAAGIYGMPASTIGDKDERRQVGKVSSLALGFLGGAGAFGSMAKLYRLDLDPLFDTAWHLIDDEQRDRALKGWKERGRSSGMKKRHWLAAEAVKLKWREENPEVVDYAKALEQAAIEAMIRPGETIWAGLIGYRKTGSWLRCILPSGRSLFYAFPRLTNVKTPWGTTRKGIRFWAQDGVTKQWREFAMYPGLNIQNVVQAASRDVMFEAVERCEDAGYLNILRIHDEGVFETDEDEGDDDEFHALFVQPPAWAPGLPIAADGWTGKRYRK